MINTADNQSSEVAANLEEEVTDGKHNK